jgi:hypothetical protein
MSGLILPPGFGKKQPQESTFSSTIQLNDSELKRLLEGPVAWAQLREGSSMNIDQFVRAFREKIEEQGFTVEIKVYDTNQPGVYNFEAEINGRHSGSKFDPDRQVHEVVNNLLELKGDENKGWIKSKDDIKRLLDHEGPVNKGGHHDH